MMLYAKLLAAALVPGIVLMILLGMPQRLRQRRQKRKRDQGVMNRAMNDATNLRRQG